MQLNSDNLTPDRVDRLIETAFRKFERYEKRVDFENREATDHLYRDYQRAMQLALDAALMAGTAAQIKLARMLP